MREQNLTASERSYSVHPILIMLLPPLQSPTKLCTKSYQDFFSVVLRGTEQSFGLLVC